MKKFFNTINKFMTEISEDNINAHAAASAFYMFMSLVPFVALLTAIIPYTGLSQETLFDAVERYMPDALCDVTRSVSKMTEIERRGGKRWDKPKKAEKSRDCGGGKF